MTVSYPALKGSRCLVTGGVGFFGSHLVLRLIAEGAVVSVIDTEANHAGTGLGAVGAQDCDVLTADAGSAVARDFVRSWRPDYLFHLAAMPYAPDTSIYQEEAYRSNVVSTWSMLSALNELPDARFVLASSACVFGASQNSPLAVGDPISPPEHYYTVTKRLAEDAVSRFRAEHKVDAVICRFGNIYGPGDRHVGRIVPRLCLQLVRNESLVLTRSTGESVFEYLYVDDAVEAILQSAFSRNPQTVWHFTGGPESRYSVSELACRLSIEYDGRSRSVEAVVVSPERTVKKYLDDSVSRAELNFVRKVPFSLGLRRTLSWYECNKKTIAAKPLPFRPSASYANASCSAMSDTI